MMVCQIYSYLHWDGCQYFDIVTNIIKEKARTHSITLSAAGVSKHSQTKGSGGERLGDVHSHTYE